MADAADVPQKTVGERFPALASLEQRVERAKLEKALAEAHAGIATSVPKLGLELEKDTLGKSEGLTSLGPVLAQRAAVALADDIAEKILDAGVRAEMTPTRIVVTSDASLTRRGDVLLNLQPTIDRFSNRLTKTLFPEKSPKKRRAAAGAAAQSFAPVGLLAPAAAVLGLVGEAINSFAALTAHQYQYGSVPIPVSDTGFDLQLAGMLPTKKRSHERFSVEVERLTPTKATKCVVSFQKLVDNTLLLVAAVERADAEATVATQVTEQLVKDVAAVDAELLALAGKLDDGPSSARHRILVGRRDELAAELVSSRSDLIGKLSARDELTDLLTSIRAFLQAALTPEAEAPAPLIQAARAEALFQTGTGETVFLAYARLVAAGSDQVADASLGKDYWSALTGVAVEWAVFQDGNLLDGGVRNALQNSKFELGDPAKSFRCEWVGYSPYTRAKDEGPRPATS